MCPLHTVSFRLKFYMFSIFLYFKRNSDRVYETRTSRYTRTQLSTSVKILKSSNPVWIELGTEVTAENQWKSRWKDVEVKNAELVVDPTQKLPGYDFSCSLWTTMNGKKVADGRRNHLVHKLGMSESLLCGCGDILTTRHIVARPVF